MGPCFSGGRRRACPPTARGACVSAATSLAVTRDRHGLICARARVHDAIPGPAAAVAVRVRSKAKAPSDASDAYDHVPPKTTAEMDGVRENIESSNASQLHRLPTMVGSSGNVSRSAMNRRFSSCMPVGSEKMRAFHENASIATLSPSPGAPSRTPLTRASRPPPRSSTNYCARAKQAAGATRFVDGRHLKKRPRILTTNEPLAACGSLVHDDDDLAAAIVERTRCRWISARAPRPCSRSAA